MSQLTNKHKLICFVLFVSSWSFLSGCATRRYVRQQIAINNCAQTIRSIDRDLAVLNAAADMDAERSGPQRSEIGQKAHDKTVYEMFLRLQKRNETTKKMIEAGQ